MKLVLRSYFSGAWSHVRSSLNETEIFLLTKCLIQGSPELLWGAQQVPGSVCDLLWGGAQMEQSFWIVLCSMCRVALQINCRECPLHRDNTAWVGVKYPVILLLHLAKGGKGRPSSMAAFKHCTWSLEALHFFPWISFLQCDGTFYSATLYVMLRYCSITI